VDPKLNLTIAITVSLVLSPNFTSADTAILKTGEAIETENSWEQGDKIFFDLHGLVLSVDKKNVQQIIPCLIFTSHSLIRVNLFKPISLCI
jgi:hypothetical protein